MDHDVVSVLLDILVVLVAAKAAAEIAERIHIPAVVGEIVAGILIGPSALDLVGSGDVLRTLGELGVVLLLLEVGMEMDLGELGKVGRTSLLVATVGVVAPLVLGLGAMTAIGDDFDTALFVAAALTATSVGITARVFGDLHALATTEARVVLGAAVADDVMGLMVLTVVVRVVTEGSVSTVDVVTILLGAIAFLVVGGLLALWIAPRLFDQIERRARSAGTIVALALAFTLAFAELADAAQLAVVVGAFLAGLALGRTVQSERIRRELAPVGHLFIPVFFLQIGIDVDVSSFGRLTVLRDAAILLAVAVVGKLVSAIGTAGNAERQAARRARHAPTRRGRVDLRHDRPRCRRARRRPLRRAPARRAGHDARHAGAAAVALRTTRHTGRRRDRGPRRRVRLHPREGGSRWSTARSRSRRGRTVRSRPRSRSTPRVS